MGSVAHGVYSNGDTGVTRLIRTVCKSVQERGCKKSGKIVCFATYLKDEFGITSIPLFPFLGNRFNILFVNAAGVYFLYDQLPIFSEELSTTINYLMQFIVILKYFPSRLGAGLLG